MFVKEVVTVINDNNSIEFDKETNTVTCSCKYPNEVKMNTKENIAKTRIKLDDVNMVVNNSIVKSTMSIRELRSFTNERNIILSATIQSIYNSTVELVDVTFVNSTLKL